MTQFWEIATILSSKRVVLHLHEFPDVKLTPRYLYDKLGVEADVIFAELGAEDNFDILGALYLARFEVWGGVLHKPTVDPSSDGTEPIVLPPTFASSVEDRGRYLDYLEDGADWHNDAFDFWELPRRDLVLPFDSSMRCELFNLTLEQSQAYDCVAPTPYTHPETTIAELRQTTTELRNEVEARSVRWADEGRYLSALRRIDAVLRLQSRHWASRIHERGAPAKVGFLSDARKAVSNGLDRAAILLNGNETAIAGEAMERLRDGSLRTAAEQLAYDPTSLKSREAKDLSTALGDAAEALARSGHAVDFTKEHVLPALKEACSHPSYGLAQAVAVTKDPEFRQELDVGWQSTLEDIESQVGIFKGTPYAPLVTGAKLFKGGTTVVASMLEPGTFVPLWNALHDANSYNVPMRMGGVLMRWLLTCSRSTSKNPLFIGSGGGINYKAFASELSAMRLLTGHARTDLQFKIAKEAQLNRAFLRSRVGLGLNWTLSLITLLAAMDTHDEASSLEYVAGIGAGMAGLFQTGAKTAEYLAVVRGAKDVLVENHYLDARLLGRIATVFGAIATIGSLRRNLDDPSLGSVVPEYLQLGSSVLTAAGWGASAAVPIVEEYFTFAASRAAGLTIAGGVFGTLAAVLSFAAVVWDMVTRPAELPGTYRVLHRYREYLDGAKFSGLMADVDIAVNIARINDCFEPLAANASPARGSGDAPPSWHDAHVLGLDGSEIVAMFRDTSFEALAAEGIEASFRGSKGPRPR